MAKTRKNYFVTNDELRQEFMDWYNSAINIEDRVVGEKFAIHIMQIAQHLMNHHRFVRYPQQVKDDIVSDSILKVLKNLKNIKVDKMQGSSLFCYITKCCFTAAITYLAKYYKEKNSRRQLLVEALETAKSDNLYKDTGLIEQLKQEIDLYDDNARIDEDEDELF